MENKKLISVRVNADNLKTIDEAAASLPWRKRSDYVDAALDLMAALIKRGAGDKILRFSGRFDTIDKFEFKYHREVK